MSKIDPFELVEYMKNVTGKQAEEMLKPDVYKGMCILRDKIILAWRNGELEKK